MDKPSLSSDDAKRLRGLRGTTSPLTGDHWCFCRRKSQARRVCEGSYLIFGFPGLAPHAPQCDDSFSNFSSGTYGTYLAERGKVEQLEDDVQEFCKRFTDETLPVPGWSTLLFTTHEAFEFAAIHAYQQFDCAHVRLLSDPLGTAAEDLGISLWKFRARLLYPWFAMAIQDDVIQHVWTDFRDSASFLDNIEKTLRH